MSNVRFLEMTMMLYINLLLQFIVGFGLNLIYRSAMGYADENIGFIIGRAVGGVLFPLALTAAIAGIYKLITKKKMPGFCITLWILWALMTYMAIHGDIMYTTEQIMMEYR